jgi:hypothetical protein
MSLSKEHQLTKKIEYDSEQLARYEMPCGGQMA